MGFSGACRAGQAVGCGGAELVGWESPGCALWDGVVRSCL